MFCTKCGNEMPDGSKFCTKCGAPMGGGAAGAEVARGASKVLAESAAPSGKDGKAAAVSPSAPSKKKRTGLAVGVAAAAVVALAAVGIAVANPFAAPAPEPAPGAVEAPAPGSEPASEPEAPAAPEPAPAPEPEPALAIPNRYFISGTNFHPSGAYDVCLTDLEGTEAVFENPDMRPMGGFSEGKVLVTWETSEYDEEWDTEFDEMIHYGLVDDTGALVVDLTDLVHSYGYTFQGNLKDVSVTNAPTYANGRLVLFIEWSGGSYGAVIVLDEQGKVVFTVGDAEAFQFADEGAAGREFTYNLTMMNASDCYRDGVLALQGINGVMFLDVDGNVLYQTEGYPTSIGGGCVIPDDSGTVVTDYAGNVLLDITSFNVEGDIDGAAFAGDQVSSGGVVCVRAEKVNPHGGANKDLVGLYSVSAKKWIAPLAEGSLSFTAADGLVYVAADSKDRLIGGYGAEADGSSDTYSCLMDLQGAIVADAATLVASGADLPTGFDGRYLQEGYWLLGEGEDQLVAYAESGKIAGTAPAPEHGVDVPLYPDIELCYA
ncbi:zinc ribbon domain-containing protein [Adlercreutzia equolifaciens]|nr:zinc ribbon domain-containing protein [Adlercreutzia equolifaciens]MCP2078212.1 zinc-ribbon domain-containing protein [Adlercreutzia equolifaciens subsp. celatus DSM 18785]